MARFNWPIKALGMRIKDAENASGKRNDDYEKLASEKAQIEAQLKVALDKTQQNDKGQFFSSSSNIELSVTVIAYLNKQLNQMPMVKSDNRLSDGYIPIPQQTLSARYSTS